VGELTRLRYADVVWPLDPRIDAAHEAIELRLPVTKTRLSQWVSIRNMTVARSLHQYLLSHTLSPASLIFACGPAPPNAVI
jgi:hypothetical protein